MFYISANFHNLYKIYTVKLAYVVPSIKQSTVLRKSKKYHTVKTVPNSYRKILEKSKIDTSDMQIHDPHFPGLVQALLVSILPLQNMCLTSADEKICQESCRKINGFLWISSLPP
jgi:hypothetical protein